MVDSTLHARYLTERRLVSGEPTINFTPDIDPKHILDEVRGGRYVRVRDNVVQYLEKVTNQQGEK